MRRSVQRAASGLWASSSSSSSMVGGGVLRTATTGGGRCAAALTTTSGSRRCFASSGPAASAAKKTIEVYATSWCPFCAEVRALLKRKGVQFTEIDVTDPAVKEQMIKRTNGKKTVPQVFVDGEYIGDCDGTHKLDAQGLLDVKLGLKEQSTA